MPMKVTGRGLEFRDSSGRVRAKLEQEADGDIALITYDTLGNETGRPVLADPDAAAITTDAITLSAGWGTGASVAISGARSNSNAGGIQVTVGATPAANPTVTVTFPEGTHGSAPRSVIVQRHGGSATAANNNVWVTSVSATAFTFQWLHTGTAANTVMFRWMVRD